ncbi:copper resistance protein B [Luteimonas sp. SDU82]|uniref:copper resistance protein B n=1 Tax=Luteimonas sp. SDU82 TaxID=3422592 RepID=UPI003EB813FA
MGHCVPDGARRPREPIPPVTQADRDAAFPVLSHGHTTHGATTYTRVKFDRFEAWDSDEASGQAWEGSASVGGDLHRVWLRSSGSRSAGRTTAASAELRWSRAVARWWDVVAGARHDVRPGPSRTRAAIGVQGLAPYQFEVSAMAYFGDGGLAAKLEAEYDLRFSNRLVLQPMLELELQARDDPARGTGSGLSKAEAGLRLRYEVTRRFAPYLGLAHERSFRRTADYHAAHGEAPRETRLVAGVRFWF